MKNKLSFEWKINYYTNVQYCAIILSNRYKYHNEEVTRSK